MAKQVVGRGGNVVCQHIRDLRTKDIHIDDSWISAADAVQIVEFIVVDGIRRRSTHAHKDSGELRHRGSGPERGRLAAEIDGAGSNQAAVGIVNIQVEISFARQTRATVEQGFLLVEQDLHRESAGGLRPEFVPVFVAGDGEGRNHRAGINRGPRGTLADARQGGRGQASVVVLEGIGMEDVDPAIAVRSRPATDGIQWGDVQPLDALVNHVGQPGAAARNRHARRDADPSAALIGGLTQGDQIAEPVIPDNQPVAGVGGIAQDVEPQRLIGRTVACIEVRVSVTDPDANQVVAQARLDANFFHSWPRAGCLRRARCVLREDVRLGHAVETQVESIAAVVHRARSVLEDVEDVVGGGAADEDGVEAGAAVERVVAGAADERVIALVAEEPIVARAAFEEVVARAAFERDRTGAPDPSCRVDAVAAVVAAQGHANHVPDRVVGGRGPQFNVVVAGQGIDEESRGVDEQDARPVVEADGEVPDAVGPHVGGAVPGDDGDVVVAVGAQEDALAATGDADPLDVVPADALGADRVQPTLVILRAGFEDVGARRVEVDGVAGGAADRVAAVHEHRDRAGRDVEGVVAPPAVERQADVVGRVDDHVEEPDELQVVGARGGIKEQIGSVGREGVAEVHDELLVFARVGVDGEVLDVRERDQLAVERRRHARRIDVPRLGSSRRHLGGVAQPSHVVVGDAVRAVAAIDLDRHVPRQHGSGERRHGGRVVHIPGVEGEAVHTAEGEGHAAAQREGARFLPGACEDQGVDIPGRGIERDVAAAARIEDIDELEVVERHRQSARGRDHIAQDRHGQAIGDEVQRVAAAVGIHRDRRTDRRRDRERVIVVRGWVHSDRGQGRHERAGDDNVHSGRVGVVVVGRDDDGGECLDRRSGRNQNVVARLERDGRTGGLEGYPRVYRQVIACPRCFRGGEQDGPGRRHVRADNQGTSGSDGDASRAAGCGDGTAHRDALPGRRAARIGNDHVAAARVRDAGDVEGRRRAGRVGNCDGSGSGVGCVKRCHASLEGIGRRPDAADRDDPQPRAEDIRTGAGVGVGDRPGRDQRDAAGGLDQVQGGGADHLQVAIGRAGRHIDHPGHLQAQRCGEGADHIDLVAGQDGLVANAFGGITNDRRLFGGCHSDRRRFPECLRRRGRECQRGFGGELLGLSGDGHIFQVVQFVFFDGKGD